MVQQVQLVQQKSDQQVVQIPPQALKVVQAASATLPPVPQRVPATPSVQVAPSEPTQVPQHLCFLLCLIIVTGWGLVDANVLFVFKSLL